MARVTGAVSLLTDDTKIYGPHYTLIRRPDVQIIPLAYYEMIILACIVGKCTVDGAIEIFEAVHNGSPDQNFTFISKLRKFVSRFIHEPVKEEEKVWFDDFCHDYNLASPKRKLRELKNKSE